LGAQALSGREGSLRAGVAKSFIIHQSSVTSKGERDFWGSTTRGPVPWKYCERCTTPLKIGSVHDFSTSCLSFIVFALLNHAGIYPMPTPFNRRYNCRCMLLPAKEVAVPAHTLGPTMVRVDLKNEESTQLQLNVDDAK